MTNKQEQLFRRKKLGLFREKEGEKEEIDYSVYRTNTFLEEYLSLQN